MIQKQFAERVVKVVKDDPRVIGLAAAGSWINDELDEFSDLDLILVTQQKISDDKNSMLAYAESFGELLSGFTGEHVGEPRVLICLYNDPLLHVDIKFLTPGEFRHRIETPAILSDTNGQLESILKETEPKFPYPDYQWIEDRFWTWIHYALLKIGRGEFVEAMDFFAFLRMSVFGPLLHIKNGLLPRGVRKMEELLPANDLDQLLRTIPTYSGTSLLGSLQQSVTLYRQLRSVLYPSGIIHQSKAEKKVMEYFEAINKQ